MRVVRYENCVRYIPENGKKLYFEKDEERLYDEIVVSLKDHRVVKEK